MALVAIGLLAFAMPASVGAVKSDPKMFVSGDNTFYVYAKSGEKLSAYFTKSSQVEPLGLPSEDIKVTLTGPDAAAQTCVLAKSLAPGQGCGFRDVVVPKTGVWKIEFSLPSSAQLYPQVSPTVRWGRNMFSWDISVKDATGEKAGRLWSELYAVRQPIDPQYVTDLQYYYISESGYLYRATYKGFNGQIATFSADAFGIREGKSCASAYQSIEVTDTRMTPSFGECGGSYKLFFEQPSGDLPASAARWDGESDWVRPRVSRPVAGDLRFTPTESIDDALSGTIRFTLKNYVGQFNVRIDTNNDGNYEAREDVKIVHRINKLDSGDQVVEFNGLDGFGEPIARDQRIGIKIDITKTAEIHLVNADVEGRTGGIELVRLSGANAPSARMCWNDTSLAPVAEALMTKTLDGRNCPQSTGGVHGWAYGTGAWGDVRYIDDWAYAAADVDGTVELKYPAENEAAAVADSANKNMGMIAAASAGIIVTIVVVALIIKRHRTKVALAAAQRQSTQMTTVQPPAYLGQSTPLVGYQQSPPPAPRDDEQPPMSYN